MGGGEDKLRQSEKTGRRGVNAGLLWLLKKLVFGIWENVIKSDHKPKQCIYVSKNQMLECGTSVCGIFARYSSKGRENACFEKVNTPTKSFIC